MAVRTPYLSCSGINFQLWADAAINLRTPDSEYIETYGVLLAESAKKCGASVIHAASNYLNGLAAAKAAALLGVASVYEVRGLWHITRGFSLPAYRYSEHFQYCEKRELLACQSVDKVITISDALKFWLISKGIPQSKISVVGNAASQVLVTPDLIEETKSLRSRYCLEQGRPVIGYIGSLVAYEGLDKLIKLMASTPVGERPYLFIAGDGVAKSSLESLANKLGVARNVLLVGRIGEKQVSAHYGLFDLVALPREASELTRLVPPVKPFEILAHGCPLVVSESVATAVGSTMGSPLLTANFDALSNINELVELATCSEVPIPAVPTWDQRAQEILSIYRQLG
jgi:glycosyltransferase involved in cell wall biosynthesis